MREQLRKAGRKIAEVDKAYANKVGDFIAGDPRKRKDGWVGVTRAAVGGVASSQPGSVNVEFGSEPGKWAKRGAKAAEYAIPTAGLGIRYGIPAAGVALAGKGLMDLTAQINQMSSQQTGSTLMPYKYTDNDYAVADGVVNQLTSGALTGSQLNQNVVAGMYTKPQQALIADSHDFSKDEPYPYGNQTIAEGIFTR